MARILGIDPGLLHTGWGIIESQGSHLRFIACGTIHPPTERAIAVRLKTIHHELLEVIHCYQPAEAALEETFVNRNALTSLKLGQARGAILLTLSLAGLSVAEYAARVVKKSVTGTGKAEKGQIMGMVRMLLPGAAAESEDAADALAVAISHASHRRMAMEQVRVSV